MRKRYYNAVVYTGEMPLQEAFVVENGMLADFVVLSENPFETDKNYIKDIKVKQTYMSGKCVFSM
ncbi:MAG: hypothetical protein IKU69_00850 [Roseburia sp.]|nr:hypothetical protein [Roseburia sp.]